jgi:hypothetical protein
VSRCGWAGRGATDRGAVVHVKRAQARTCSTCPTMTRPSVTYWAGLPVAGFFAAGEFGPVGGRNFLHGSTRVHGTVSR